MSRLKRSNITIDTARELIKRADKARANTYPEAGKYAVALITDKGNIYEGVSYNSDTYTLTMHSEATALANAAINGEKNIVAITGPNCHICKQLIWESALRSGINTQIILQEKDEIKIVCISELMLLPWPDEEGNK